MQLLGHILMVDLLPYPNTENQMLHSGGVANNHFYYIQIV